MKRYPVFAPPALLVALLAALLIFAACGPGERESTGSAGAGGASLRGTIKVSGAWALYPMMVRWAEEFRKVHPGVRIDVSAGGAGKGIADTIAGLVDIGMVSREIKAEEVRQGAVHVPVTKDAVVPTINASNPLAADILARGFPKSTLADLWIGGQLMAWGHIAGRPAGDLVRVYTRSDACGAAETWASYLGNRKQEDLQGVAVYGDPGLTEAVRKDVRAIGYNNLNYAFSAATGLPVDGIAVVSIDVNGNGRIDPEEDIGTKRKAIAAIRSGVYPSPPARDLYLIMKGAFHGPAREFIRWILTDGQRFVDEAGYISLSERQVRDALDRVGR